MFLCSMRRSDAACQTTVSLPKPQEMKAGSLSGVSQARAKPNKNQEGKEIQEHKSSSLLRLKAPEMLTDSGQRRPVGDTCMTQLGLCGAVYIWQTCMSASLAQSSGTLQQHQLCLLLCQISGHTSQAAIHRPCPGSRSLTAWHSIWTSAIGWQLTIPIEAQWPKVCRKLLAQM